ncbi:MAG: MBL fold metallo-hydrolase [Clostridiales bacterium]|nr:MBL fold metallo-hydrolase [Clostridiales bacterium]
MTVDKLTLGDFEVFGLRDGFFYLDGGAMFGIVPKVLWEKKCPADSKNRIKLALNSLLVKTPEALILVETGIGSKSDQKFQDIYRIERKPGLLASLERMSFRPEDIDVVINTHLHFDHCGGNTSHDKKGRITPTFPRAKHIIQKGEWESALDPNEREKSSYIAENFLPLEKHGLLELVHGGQLVVPGVEVVLTPGHTSSHQAVKVRSGNQTLFYLGDLVPTSAHIGLPYIMSYDLYPLVTIETRKRCYEQALAENWILAFVHDPIHYFGRIRKAHGKYEFAPLET